MYLLEEKWFDTKDCSCIYSKNFHLIHVHLHTEGQRWGSNTTSVDLYVKKEKVEEVKGALEKASMDFRVLIDDVQQAVDDENPPITSEELNEFTSRKGNNYLFILLISGVFICMCVFTYTCYYIF